MLSIASSKRLPKSAEAKAAKELAGQRAEQLRGVAGRRVLAAEVAAESISTWSEPGTRLATAVASLGSMPALSRNCCASGSIAPPDWSIRPPMSTKTSARLPLGAASTVLE